MNRDRFWDFPQSAKWDQLDEHNPRHAKLIINALEDTETGVECIDRETYSMYGEEEALLVRPKSVLLFICLDIYRGLCAIMSNNQTG